MTHPIIEQIRKADNAIVAEDFDTLLGIYTDDAILVVEPGKNAEGKAAIRTAFEAIAVYFKNGLQVKQDGMEILETGDTALVLANTVLSAPNHLSLSVKRLMCLIRVKMVFGYAQSITRTAMTLLPSLNNKGGQSEFYPVD
ncbi:DUF4440 domain-containing protein [Vibrio sp. ED004]|uniref:YybH family protein n=1 Tax=Vibrio sp. ED004 TaxID=2785124 RepID=UPI0020612AB5|nr:nuclear transport factor 2 family protein [Vibrio sp. ED004]UPR56528.1 DUF4440 domain-containing protein [Vibrio sp. ED004]